MTAFEVREKIRGMRRAAVVVYEVLSRLREKAKEGVSTWELNSVAEGVAKKRSARPAFKGYRNFPASVCFAVNSEVVHGIPSREKVLREGDIVGMDFGAFAGGFYGDSAITVPIGRVDGEASRLLKVAENALEKGIEKALPSNCLFEISKAVQSYVESRNFSVVRDFVGHGIGKNLHEEPQVPNYIPDPSFLERGPMLEAGMGLAIEPMVNTGAPQVKILEDNWTVVTSDGSLSAHFEHTVAVTDNGPEVLTRVG